MAIPISHIMPSNWVDCDYIRPPRLPAAHTSFAVLLQPVLTIVWGVILLSEKPSLQQIVGMTLIFSAIIAVTLFGESQTGGDNIDQKL